MNQREKNGDSYSIHKVYSKSDILGETKKDNYILINGIIQEEEIAIIYMDSINISASNCIKQTLRNTKNLTCMITISWGIASSTVTRDRTTRQKINSEILQLTQISQQSDILDVYRKFHPTILEYTFFSIASRMFPKIQNRLIHKSKCVSKCKGTEITPCILSDNSAVKLEING